jgi:hypothetical protein
VSGLHVNPNNKKSDDTEHGRARFSVNEQTASRLPDGNNWIFLQKMPKSARRRESFGIRNGSIGES